MKDLAELKVYRKASDNYIFIKSPWLENHFKLMSEAQLGEPKTQVVYSIDGKGEIYEFYKVRRLPQVPYSMQSNWDVLNNYGWLRSVGVSKGIEIPIITPLTKRMAAELTSRVSEVLQFLYAQGEVGDDEVIQHTLYKV